VVPDARKAKAVQACLEGEISPSAPGSILRTHPSTTIYFDRESGELLSPGTLSLFSQAGS
jgi:glucosamine-6-phosphate deaminase